MGLFWLSLIAGILTVLAPCILPLLPIVIGRSAQDEHKLRPYVVSLSLAIAVVVFTLVLKASTALIAIPPSTWSYISGSIIIFFGLISVFPNWWEIVSVKLGFSRSSNELLAKAGKKQGLWGDVLLGMALGPVFTSCSPTYFLILATVLPESFARGTWYLIVYAIGLSGTLLLIGLAGQKLAKRLNVLADPHGWFKRGLGVLFILVGLFIMSGLDKKVQTAVLDNGYFDITKVEQLLLKQSDSADESVDASMANTRYPVYNEIVNPSGFINSEPFELSDLVGKKVILLDFMTYSCINCQRTFPYLNAWYDAYKDEGLEIVGIHTPEFAFERLESNVRSAADKFGLEFPIVLDNEYATWRAYGNRFWPRKYLIDINGQIVYDHIGEGAYEETEQKIQELLQERARQLNTAVSFDMSEMQHPEDAEKVDFSAIQSRETYLGSRRSNEQGIVVRVQNGITTFARPEQVEPNRAYLVGEWKITPEYAEAVSSDATILYKYQAKKVFLVMGSDSIATVHVLHDGKTPDEVAGNAVVDGVVTVEEETLYRLIEGDRSGEHVLELEMSPGVKAFAFTFG